MVEAASAPGEPGFASPAPARHTREALEPGNQEPKRARRWWIVGGASVMTSAPVIGLWMIVADGYVRLLMDVAIYQFIC